MGVKSIFFGVSQKPQMVVCAQTSRFLLDSAILHGLGDRGGELGVLQCIRGYTTPKIFKGLHQGLAGRIHRCFLNQDVLGGLNDLLELCGFQRIG